MALMIIALACFSAACVTACTGHSKGFYPSYTYSQRRMNPPPFLPPPSRPFRPSFYDMEDHSGHGIRRWNPLPRIPPNFVFMGPDPDGPSFGYPHPNAPPFMHLPPFPIYPRPPSAAVPPNSGVPHFPVFPNEPAPPSPEGSFGPPYPFPPTIYPSIFPSIPTTTTTTTAPSTSQPIISESTTTPSEPLIVKDETTSITTDAPSTSTTDETTNSEMTPTILTSIDAVSSDNELLPDVTNRPRRRNKITRITA